MEFAVTLMRKIRLIDLCLFSVSLSAELNECLFFMVFCRLQNPAFIYWQKLLLL